MAIEIIKIEDHAIHTHLTSPTKSMLATNHRVRSILFIRQPKQGNINSKNTQLEK